MVANPFKPTAGKMPPVLIGRQNVIDDFTDGLLDGAGAPGRLMLITDVKNAYLETVCASGKTIDEVTADEAARLTTGHPYLVQLVGYYMWQAAQREGHDHIDGSDVQRGYRDAIAAFGDAVCTPAYDGLSVPAREFVAAMADDAPQPSRPAEIAERLGHSRSWANKYRQVLMNEMVIKSAGHGYVEFAIPYMSDWLRRRA